jgi:phosphoketolase
MRQAMVDKRAEHHSYVRETGVDLPEITNFSWSIS